MASSDPVPTTAPAESISASSVTSESPSTPASGRRTHYIQCRLERKHREKQAVRDKVDQARKKLVDNRDREARLRQTEKREEQTFLEWKQHLGNVEKEMKKAQAKYESAQKEVEGMQKSINQIRREITEVEGSVRDCETDLQRLEMELEMKLGSGMESETAEATRQAEMLDMDPSEIRALAIRAVEDRVFGDQIARVAQNTETLGMTREIQSEMYRRMTGVTPEEFREVMQRILSTKEAILSEAMAGDTDGHGDDAEELENACNKIEQTRESGSDIVHRMWDSDDDYETITSTRGAKRSLARSRRSKRRKLY